MWRADCLLVAIRTRRVVPVVIVEKLQELVILLLTLLPAESVYRLTTAPPSQRLPVA